jgi:Fic family protein
MLALGSSPSPKMIEGGEDVVRTYTEDEEKKLALNLEALLDQIHRGEFRSTPLTVVLLHEFHAALFHQVRDHAGKIRSPGRGSEYLLFGPNRSEHRNAVPRLVKQAIDGARREMDRLADQLHDADYELHAIKLGLALQAELIRIHAFEDGNGRTSRAMTDYVFVAFGLRPIPIEAVKSEYNECLNQYHRERDIEPLVDLYLRLYAGVLDFE